MSVGWEKDEDRFLLSQLKMLALKRLQQLRPHSIDLFFLIYAAYSRLWMRQNNITLDRPKTSVEQQLHALEAGLVLPRNLPSPESILRDISLVQDCQALTKDIQLFFTVESDVKLSSDAQANAKASKGSSITSAASYWSAMQVLVDEREKELIAKDPSQASSAAAASDIILPEVLETIDSMMEGKTIDELRELELEVNTLLSAPADPSAPIDEEYWRSLMVRLKYFKAKEHVTSVYKMVVKDIRDNPNANAQELPEAARIVASSSTSAPAAAEKYADEYEEVDEDGDGRPARSSTETANFFGLEEDEPMLDEETMLRMEMAKGLGKDEAAFGEDEAALALLEKSLGPSESEMRAEIRKTLHGFQMGDKFRPRKPKYYNRVKTGFEWTKYNQIHYDHDNPPPKVVQGYKFTLFYPDLIDPTKAPTFSIEPTESPDYAVLRFRAGPPYIDVAFRIANREWSVTPKHGYKCMFARGVLYLWFNFKRMRYRR